MKPHNSLIFLCAVLAILAGISVLMPDNGVSVYESYRISFGKLADILPKEEKAYADISAIIGTEAIDLDTTSTEPETIELDFGADDVDSLLGADSVLLATPVDTVRMDAKTLRQRTYPIEFPNDDHTILFTFFDKLQSVKTGRKPLRVLHYGDSQIEGDRISAVIRQYFQTQFGGSGPGFVCPYEEAGFASQSLFEHEGNWTRYARFAKKDSIVPHARFGHLSSFARFSPLDYQATGEVYNASITITGKEQWMYPLRQKFRTIDIYLGYNREPAFVEIYSKDSLVYMSAIPTNEAVQKISWTSTEVLKACTIKFTGKDSPDIYGIALDDTAGIAFDNIPLRGSSGLEFTRISKKNLNSIFEQLDVGLIILQFGVNVVPNIRTEYNYYEEKFTKQVLRLKSLFPNTPILIVGVSDMSRKAGNYYESYPNIELIHDVQRRIAFENDCAFWDLYSAMGGQNSMPSWVFAKPALAKKDFTHFNYKGAKIIGQMFYNTLMNEYAAYQEMIELKVEEIDSL